MLGQSLQNEVEALILELDTAFGDLPTPRSDLLVEGSYNDPERNEILQAFGSRHWKEIELESVLREREALCFLTPVGFRFLLPAYIRACLLAPVHADLIPDSILSGLASVDDFNAWEARKGAILETALKYGVPREFVEELTPKKIPELEEETARRREILTRPQKNALRHFVSFLREHRGQDFSVAELAAVDSALQK